VDWSWWTALSPLWIALIVIGIVLLIAACVSLSDSEEQRLGASLFVTIVCLLAALVMTAVFAIFLCAKLEAGDDAAARNAAARTLGPLLIALAVVFWLAWAVPVITISIGGFVAAHRSIRDESAAEADQDTERGAGAGGRRTRPRQPATELGITWLSAMPTARPFRIHPMGPSPHEPPPVLAPAA
jgi:amino acid transporter